MNTDPRIQLYLDTVIVQIKFEEAHTDVRRELESHIAELVDAEISRGLSSNAAIENALRRMGDPIEVGQKLHLAHQPKLDWYLIGLAVTLFALDTISGYQWVLSSPVRFNRFISTLLSGGLESAIAILLTLLLPLVLSCALFAVLVLWNYQKIANRAGRLYGLMLLAIALITGLTAAFWGIEALFDPLYVTNLQILFDYDMNDPYSVEWAFIGLHVTVAFLTFAPLVLIVGLAGIVSRKPWNNFVLSLILIGSLTISVVGFSAINSRYAAITFAVAAIAVMISSRARWWQITTATVVLFGSIYACYQASIILLSTRLMVTGKLPFFEQPFTAQLFTALWLILSVLIWVRTVLLMRHVRDSFGRSLGIGIAMLLGAELLLNAVGNSGLGLFPIDYYDVYPSQTLLVNIFLMMKTVAAIGFIVSIYRRRTLITSRSL